jgi:hypothetical protein
MLGVEMWHGLAIDEQAIAAEDNRGIDAIALPNCRDEVSNGGQGTSRRRPERS